jgi:protein-L-isoaspartate(D-aspartate) O-methyltransferase
MGAEEDKITLLTKLVSDGYLKSGKVIDAFREVNRELFVPGEQAMLAYKDYPLDIGHGQTISAPHMAALMTELLRPAKKDSVLEIGTGCGYQACILAKLAGMVTTVEIDPDLAYAAQENLKKSGCGNARVVLGDGTFGYPQLAPYDRIIVTCAVPEIFQSWKNQLRDGGILVVPVGGFYRQELTVVRRRGSEFTEETHGACVFVPMRGL